MTGIELLPSDQLDSRISDVSRGLSAQMRDPADLSAAELIAGPCALPVAPVAMPPQVIEPRRSVFQWFKALLRRQDGPPTSADLPT